MAGKNDWNEYDAEVETSPKSKGHLRHTQGLASVINQIFHQSVG
jgi:hypothetical protein